MCQRRASAGTQKGVRPASAADHGQINAWLQWDNCPGKHRNRCPATNNREGGPTLSHTPIGSDMPDNSVRMVDEQLIMLDCDASYPQ